MPSYPLYHPGHSQGQLLRLLLSSPGQLQRVREGSQHPAPWHPGTPGAGPHLACFSPALELLLHRHEDIKKLLAAREEKFVLLQQEAGVSKAGVREPQSWGLQTGSRSSLSLSLCWGLPRALSLYLTLRNPCKRRCVAMTISW